MDISGKIEVFLAQPNICVLATNGPGGWPHAVAMWYVYANGVVTITTSKGSQKYKNVERTGKATVVVDSRVLPYYAVTIRGDAEIGPGLSREEEYQVALRYLGEERVRKFMRKFDSGRGDNATIIIRPRRILEYQGVD